MPASAQTSCTTNGQYQQRETSIGRLNVAGASRKDKPGLPHEYDVNKAVLKALASEYRVLETP